ncbi:MAG: DUF455 family protein [Proteobacteria bacterium]|nr:DUF455 family protein [Pseudomonadota bacterium]
MEVRRFAEQVLLGTSLADKLLDVTGLTDLEPGSAIAPPSAPGRPAELPLRSAERPRFPGADRLGDRDAAATALHAFANHELLAIELMALALLRFPDADPAFRADLVRTLGEEQTHLRLYTDRLAALAQPFGTRAVSAFFWDALAPVSSPRDFCAAMGLTLEQANLDFAGHFAGVFDDVGDAVSAAILRRVLADEIAHVARGWAWFDRLRGPGDRWEQWVEALPAPLTPRRARGPGFAVGPRLRAGLDRDFIERVRTFGASRGRTPTVHWLNLPAEAGEGKQPQAWIDGLAATAMLRASPDDVVLLPREPGAVWLARIADAGFALPAIQVLPRTGAIPVAHPGSMLRPWAPTPDAAARLGSSVGRSPSKTADAEALVRLLPSLGPPDRLLCADALPTVAGTLAEVEAAIDRFRAAGHPRVVFKRPLGTSGQGQLRFFEPALLDRQRAWLRASLAEGPLRVEPWLDRVLDLSFQLDGRGLRGVVRFEASATGQFRAAALERPTIGLEPALARFWAGDGRDSGWIEAVGRRLAEAFAPDAPCGVDAFVYRDADGLRLHPYVELNPRITFGRLALDLRVRLASGCVGRWMTVGPADLRDASASSMAGLAAQLDEALPLVLHKGQLQQCALPTSDPDQAGVVLPLLVIARAREQLDAALADAGLRPLR